MNRLLRELSAGLSGPFDSGLPPGTDWRTRVYKGWARLGVMSVPASQFNGVMTPWGYPVQWDGPPLTQEPPSLDEWRAFDAYADRMLASPQPAPRPAPAPVSSATPVIFSQAPRPTSSPSFDPPQTVTNTASAPGGSGLMNSVNTPGANAYAFPQPESGSSASAPAPPSSLMDRLAAALLAPVELPLLGEVPVGGALGAVALIVALIVRRRARA